MNRLTALKRNQSGAVVVVVAILLVALLGFMALAIDVGHVYLVRAELQNAADAAAMAGAAQLYPQTVTGATSSQTIPSWASAETASSTSAPSNKAAGLVLTDYDVQTGYWNLARSPNGLQPASTTPGAQDAPAVQVTIRKANTINNGPVQLWFASVLGIRTAEVSATATAVSACPGFATGLFPMAITKSVADKASTYNSAANTIRIGSEYHYPTSEAGQWTSLDVDSNNVPTIRDLMANGNSTPLAVGDNIWIQPGTKNTIYNSVPLNKNVVLPIVEEVDTHAWVPIIGFIAFRITDSVGGSDKYVEGYFIKNMYLSTGGPIGPCYGVFTPPRLVN